MQVSISEVEKIAMLSRLSFSDEEKQKFQHDLEAILMAAQRLNELDTSGVEPTAHIQGVENVLRADTVQPSMDNDKLTAGAPERENGCFIVPRVVE